MIELKCWHSLDGFRHVLVRPGRKYLAVLVMDKGLHVRKLPLEEARYLTEPLGKPRAWSTICKHFAGHGRRNGSTKAARKFLAEARKQL